MTAIRRHQQLVEGGIGDEEVREGMTEGKNEGGEEEKYSRCETAAEKESRRVPWATLVLH